MLIALSNGGWMQVDEIDYLDLVNQGDWFRDDDGYARRTIPMKHRTPESGTCIKVHQYIGRLLGFKNQVDHINGDRLDNRRDNLRNATTQQNSSNRRAKGYYRTKNGWYSEIMIEGKRNYLGVYKTKEEAKAAYLAASKMLRGEWHSE